MAPEQFMRMAIELSFEAARGNRGGPFGCVIVRTDRVIATGQNRVLEERDPTAHAEMVAIRAACRALDHFSLQGCALYTSCEPCPMCLGAIYWARIERVYFANTRSEAAAIGFGDELFYQELGLPLDQRQIRFERLLAEEALAAFQIWNERSDKLVY
jgi:tRNA(Arg) A34 adenosine deaminase TadA